MRGRACDLDVELGPAPNVTVESIGLFVLPSLRDLSSNRRKPGWLQPLISDLYPATQYERKYSPLPLQLTV